jgi:hypothetical protein
MDVFGIMTFLRKRRESTLKLYDSTETLPIILFFQIMKNQDLSLLIQSNPKGLSVGEEKLKKIWSKISEEYYLQANPKRYKEQLRKVIKVEQLRNMITLISASYTLASLGDERGEQALEELKLKKETAQQRINIEKTRLDMLVSELKKMEANDNKQEEVSFWKTIATVERGLNRSLDIDKITVARWIAIVNDLKEHYKELDGARKNYKGRHH